MKQFLKLSLLPVAMLVVSGCSILKMMKRLFLSSYQRWSSLLNLERHGLIHCLVEVSVSFILVSPAITDDMIIAANRIGTVAAFDKVSGDELWEANLRDLDKNDFR